MSGNTAALPSDLRRSNRMQVLEVFKWGGEFTINQIAAQVGLSRQTVMKAVQFFVEQGIVAAVGKGGSTAAGGKRPDLFSLANHKRLLAIDLWPSRLNCTLLDFKGQVVDRLVREQPLPDDLERTAASVGGFARDLLARSNVLPDALCGVCISVSGTVDYRSGTLRYSSHTPGWGTDVPLARLLRPYLGAYTPVLLENTGKLSARSLLQSRELLTKRVLCLFTAWGLSGCFIERGRILNGKDSLIGEFGHMILDPDDEERCGCGSHGCFERLVSNDRIRRRAAALRAAYPGTCLGAPEALTVQAVFAASEAGDPCARRLADELAMRFATALRNITLVFDPDEVVFQGDFAAADAYFLQRFWEYLKEFQYYPNGEPFQLHLDRRPLDELSWQGAYTLLMDHYFSNLRIFV